MKRVSRPKSCWVYKVIVESKEHLSSKWKKERSFDVVANGVKDKNVVCKDIISKYLAVPTWNKRVSVFNRNDGLLDTVGGIFGNDCLEETLKKFNVGENFSETCKKNKLPNDVKNEFSRLFEEIFSLLKKDIYAFDGRSKKVRKATMTNRVAIKVENYNKKYQSLFDKIEKFCNKLVTASLFDVYNKYYSDKSENAKKTKAKDVSILKLKIDTLKNIKELLSVIHSDMLCDNIDKKMKECIVEYNKNLSKENKSAEFYLVKYYDEFDIDLVNKNTDWSKETFIPRGLITKFARKRLTVPYVRKTDSPRKPRATKEEMKNRKVQTVKKRKNGNIDKVHTAKTKEVKVEEPKTVVTLDISNESEVLEFIRKYLNIK